MRVQALTTILLAGAPVFAAEQRPYLTAATAAARWIESNGIKTDRGTVWPAIPPDPKTVGVTLYSGTTGIVLFFLEAYADSGEKKFLDDARGGADSLLKAIAGEKQPGLYEGLAGMGFALAEMYKTTHDEKYRRGAVDCVGRIKNSIANAEGDQCLLFHADPDGKDRYYLGWCHGPAGTARTFYRLYQVTGDRAWMEWTKKSMQGLLNSGIPEKRTEGFWNNVGWCCGSASVAQFGLEMYQVTKNNLYLDFSKRVTADMLSRGTRDGDGMKWIQAEHRVKPDLLNAQTGLMQGAAGIGLWLMHLDEFETGKKERITLPDSPFGSK